MSMTSQLLDQLLPVKGGWVPDERGAFVLSVLPDVVVNLIEDPAAMELHLLSAVGMAGTQRVLVDRGSEEPDLQGRQRVLMAEESGLVVALRTVDLLALGQAALTAELAAHVTFARLLGTTLLQANPPDPDAWPVPLGVVATWRECGAEAIAGDRS